MLYDYLIDVGSFVLQVLEVLIQYLKNLYYGELQLQKAATTIGWQPCGKTWVFGHIHVGVYGQVIEEESDYVGISQSIIICDRYHHIPNDDDLITGIITLLQEHCTSVTPLSLMQNVMKHTFHSSTTSFSRWHHVSTLYNGVSNVLWMPCGHRIWKI